MALIRRKSGKLDLKTKWAVIEEYIESKLSNTDIAEKYEISPRAVNRIIDEAYRKFQNVRETKHLIATQRLPDKFRINHVPLIQPEQINESFLQLLSEEDSLVLTDNELLFSEYFVHLGDEKQAVKKSKLDKGLNKGVKKGYEEGLELRSFYLRRKPNVAKYISELQKESLKSISTGRDKIQVELLSVLEKLRNNGDPKVIPQLLKTIELLGRSVAAFEDKQTIEHVGGDDALDRIFKRAQQTKEKINSTSLDNE